MFKHFLFACMLLSISLANGCSSAKTNKASVGAPTIAAQMSDQMSEGSMLILMAEGVKPETIETAFSQFGLKKEGRQASRTQNKFKFVFAGKGLKLANMLTAIRSHKSVKEVTMLSPKE